MCNQSLKNVERPCGGSNYSHPAHPVSPLEEKKNRCDENGKCTAEDRDELIACRFFIEEEVMRPGMCAGLSKLGDRCNDPCANEAAKTEYIADILRRDG
jgi:hypothetical protein